MRQEIPIPSEPNAVEVPENIETEPEIPEVPAENLKPEIIPDHPLPEVKPEFGMTKICTLDWGVSLAVTG